ncbi:MAG: nucleotide sugar dehydrogenase [Sciscionella sp.]|nr:nucleotide sugar dehydrogenase [Sciscionella sp.]
MSHDTTTDLRGQTIAVVGLGYVGLPTALSLADRNASVIGFDISAKRLDAIKTNQVDLLERDRTRLQRHLNGQRLNMSTDPSALRNADAVLVCVPTPVDEHLVPDLTALSGACATVVKHARAGQLIVLTSTTYAGCTRDLLVKPLQDKGFTVGDDIFIAFSPERIDPGVVDHVPERIPRVAGGITAECARRAESLLVHTAGSVHMVSSAEAAEMTKLLENTFRAVNIALANEFSTAAGELSVDIIEVIKAAATKPYGFMPFYPGAGVGGHCIPCDPHYLLWQLRGRRQASPLVEAAMTSIATRPRQVADAARRVLGDAGKPVAGSRVLVVGVAYKPGVADLRESPALEIIDELHAMGADVAYADPMIDSLPGTKAGVLISEPDPPAADWDLVLVHTLHPGTDYEWLADCETVLDTTYRLSHLPQRQVP